MKLVIFGLSISSSWGNGHATLWRGLCRALARRGHTIVFYERDVPYYAGHRDLTGMAGLELCLYSDWEQAVLSAKRHLAEADVAIVTSYCPDGPAASKLLLDSAARHKVFYDLDTPVTLEKLRRGEPVPYVPERGYRDFDLVLSYTGGAALEEVRSRLGAERVAPLYGSVDPDVHRPIAPLGRFRCDLSYLGTYADDRQRALEELFVEPARRLPSRRFVIGGALYPPDFPWTENIFFVRHLPPGEHPAFYCSSRLTLNVTRRAMAEMGFCPSGRLFEAAACGSAIVSDEWKGLDQFFEPGREILIARGTEDVRNAIELDDGEVARIGAAARDRALAEHTADHRACELEALLESGSELVATSRRREV